MGGMGVRTKMEPMNTILHLWGHTAHQRGPTLTVPALGWPRCPRKREEPDADTGAPQERGSRMYSLGLCVVPRRVVASITASAWTPPPL